MNELTGVVMEESKFIEDFKLGSLGIYICVSSAYNGELSLTNTLKRKLNSGKIGIVAWLKKEKALQGINEIGLDKKGWKVIQIFGNDYKVFINSFNNRLQDQISLSIDLNE